MIVYGTNIGEIADLKFSIAIVYTPRIRQSVELVHHK